MSGIVGIYYLDGRPVERTDVQRMVDSIAHRGPDGSGVWTDGSVGLGHRMLWTTPESLHEKLPLTNKSGDFTITADARIDNRDELFSTLDFNSRPRETITDSELILAAYEKWGEKCPEKLLGDFSFAIWDNRKKIVYCARDPIGIKPFYYYFNGKTFRWSSEPKAIFEDASIPKEPNLQLICLYLLNRFDEREETLYKDVYRLPGSQFMVLENGKIRKEQYWDIDPNNSIHYKTDEEYAEHFLSLFKEAVKVRLRSHGPVGALLSGGLDSSSIVCTAQLLYQEKSIPDNGFESFSIVFDNFPCDERQYIDEVVRKWDVKANYFPYEDDFSWVDFTQIYRFPDVGYFPTLLMMGPPFKNAQQKGIKVILDGIGGDEFLAASFDHLTDFMFQGRIREVLSRLWRDSPSYSCSRWSVFFNYCLKPAVPRPIKKYLKKVLYPFRGNGIPPWINEDQLKKSGVDKPTKTTAVRFPTRSQQRIYNGLWSSWNTNVVWDIGERFSSFFGIESRFPFFDTRLIRFLLGLPEEQRWGTKWSKSVLRKSMQGVLPEAIRTRRDKADFSCMIDFELRDRQAHRIKDFILASNLASFGFIHRDRFKKLLEHYQDGRLLLPQVRNSISVVVWLELCCRSIITIPSAKGRRKENGSRKKERGITGEEIPSRTI